MVKTQKDAKSLDTSCIDKIKLGDVNLVGVELHALMPGDFIDIDEVELKVSHDYKWQHVPEDDTPELFCFVATNIELKFKPEFEGYVTVQEGRVVYGGCLFVVRYNIPSNLKLNDETMMYITKEHASLHAAPSIRSYLNSQLVQMGIHGLSLPIFEEDRS